jgi:hypothetical protein
MFPKSSQNNVAALVVVDHFTKFLVAIPLKDKKSISVCKALNNQVLPTLLKIPNRILTDNGPEFRSTEFNNVLDDYNISHVYSTKYKASGNGAVERSNRTITELLKGLIDNNPQSWDSMLAKSVIVYNNTIHTQLGVSPAELILQTAHQFDDSLPINSNTISTWNEGHPKFAPFSINQKVAYKINKIGNQLKYKLGRKYNGPFKIVKVQSNGVSYEIKTENSNIIQKVHHKQLKPWKDPPYYLKRYIEIDQLYSTTTFSDPVQDTSDDSYNGELFICSSSSDTGMDKDKDSSTSTSSYDHRSSSNTSVNNGREQVIDSLFNYTHLNETNIPNFSGFSSKDKEIIQQNRLHKRQSRSFAELRKRIVSLDRLHCSEPIDNVDNYDDIMIKEIISQFKVNDNDYPSPRVVNNMIDWEFTNNDIILGRDEFKDAHNFKASTPCKSRSEVSGKAINISPISDEYIVQDSIVHKKDTNFDNTDNFLQWIEQSLTMHEELVEEVINRYMRLIGDCVVIILCVCA